MLCYAKSLQLCPTLCNPIDGSPPGSAIPGILQARKLEWAAISFSKAWMWKVKVKSLSRVQLLATPWTAAHQAPPSMGFSRQEYWSGVPSPSLLESRVSPYFSSWGQFTLKNICYTKLVGHTPLCSFLHCHFYLNSLVLPLTSSSHTYNSCKAHNDRCLFSKHYHLPT